MKNSQISQQGDISMINNNYIDLNRKLDEMMGKVDKSTSRMDLVEDKVNKFIANCFKWR